MKNKIIFLGILFSNFVLANFRFEISETFRVKNQFQNYKFFKKSSDNFCRKKIWIRNFHKEENGGGHQWMSLRAQRMEKDGFNCYNWRQCTKGRDCNEPQFSCIKSESPLDPSCLAQSVTPEQSFYLLNWMANLELTGVPNVESFNTKREEVICSVDPKEQSKPGSKPRDLKIKTVFSPDTYTCCLGVGTYIPEGGTPDDCCSGLIKDSKCALPDYANLSVYFNVYVSTEAHDLKPGLVDEKTGYIKNLYSLERLACTKHACASNKVARGVAISNLKVPGHEDSNFNIRSFVVSNDGFSRRNKEVSSLYDAGLRWNNQVYCAPEKLISNVTVGLSVTDCSIFQ